MGFSLIKMAYISRFFFFNSLTSRKLMDNQMKLEIVIKCGLFLLSFLNSPILKAIMVNFTANLRKIPVLSSLRNGA